MQSLRVKLAVGVAVLGAAGVGTAAIAHDRSVRRESLRLRGGADALDAGCRDLRGVDQPRQDEIRYTLSYRGPFDANRQAGPSPRPTSISARAPSTAGSSRSCAATSATARRARRPARPRARVSGTITPAQVVGGAADQGIARERVRASSCGRCAPARRTPTCTRRRTRRRDPRPDRRRRRSSRPLLSPQRAPVNAGALSFRRVEDYKRMRLRGLHHVTAISWRHRAHDRVLSRHARAGDRPRRAVRRRSRRPPRVVRLR